MSSIATTPPTKECLISCTMNDDEMNQRIEEIETQIRKLDEVVREMQIPTCLPASHKMKFESLFPRLLAKLPTRPLPHYKVDYISD